MAIADVQRCLQGRNYDSFPITTSAVSSSSSNIYADESKVEELNNASKSRTENDEDLLNLTREYKFLTRHAVQRTFQIEFTKCMDAGYDYY